MPTIEIWDGNGAPAPGQRVLAHLASCKAWVEHVVVDHRVVRAETKGRYLVLVNLEKSEDTRSWKNQRSLDDIRPLTYAQPREGVDGTDNWPWKSST